MKNIISAIPGFFLKVCIFKYIYKNKELRFLCYYLVVTPVRVVRLIDNNPDTNGTFYPGKKPYIEVSIFSSSGIMSTLVHELVHARQYRVGNRNFMKGITAWDEMYNFYRETKTFCRENKFEPEFEAYYCDPVEVEARFYQEKFTINI